MNETAERSPESVLAEYYDLLLQKEALDLSDSLPKFIEGTWPIIEPGTKLQRNWHIDCISDYLKAVRIGHILRLVINIPPRYMKSILVTVNFPVWWWTDDATMRFIFVSFSKDLSKKHSVDRRTIIESEWFNQRWGHKVRLADDQNEKSEYQNTQRGHMISTSVGAGITGKGGNCIIIDDPQNPEIVESKLERMQAINFMDSTLSTRLDDKKTGRQILVMQRLGVGDATDHVLKQGGWTLLKLPNPETEKRTITLPCSKQKIERKAGDILWPEREGKKELDRMKLVMSWRFTGQYGQAPSPPEGNIIKRAWWKYYSKLPSALDEVIDSWDASFKDTDGSDNVSGQKWARVGADAYLVRRTKMKMDFTETVLAVVTLANLEPISFARLIEDKANGPAIISTLQHKCPGVIAVEPRGSKLARAYAATPWAQAGNCYLPNPELEGNGWVYDFIEELANFKGHDGEPDDDVDAWSQAMIWFMENSFGGAEEWLKQLSDKQIADRQKELAEAEGKRDRFLAKEPSA